MQHVPGGLYHFGPVLLFVGIVLYWIGIFISQTSVLVFGCGVVVFRKCRCCFDSCVSNFIQTEISSSSRQIFIQNKLHCSINSCWCFRVLRWLLVHSLLSCFWAVTSDFCSFLLFVNALLLQTRRCFIYNNSPIVLSFPVLHTHVSKKLFLSLLQIDDCFNLCLNCCY